MALFKKKKEAKVVEEGGDLSTPDKKKPAVKKAAKAPVAKNKKSGGAGSGSAGKAPTKVKKTIKTTGDAYRVLIRPMVTEKSAGLATDGVYLFEVAVGSDKVEVRHAIKALYGVTPRRVNIMNRKGKVVRFGRTLGKRKDWRAAYVFLKKGDHIDVHEGV